MAEDAAALRMQLTAALPNSRRIIDQKQSSDDAEPPSTSSSILLCGSDEENLSEGDAEWQEMCLRDDADAELPEKLAPVQHP